MRCLLALSLATGLLLGACGDQQETGQQETGGQHQEQVKQRSQHATTAFQQSVEAVLEDANRQINQLAKRNRAEGGGGQREVETRLEELRRRRIALRQDLQRVERVSGMRANVLRAEIRRQLSRLQRDLEVARLKTIRSRREFEREVQAQIEEVETQIEQVDHRLHEVGRPIRSDYWRPIVTLQKRYRQLRQRLAALQAASSDEFDDMRHPIIREIAALRADVRHLANEMEQATNRRSGS